MTETEIPAASETRAPPLFTFTVPIPAEKLTDDRIDTTIAHLPEQFREIIRFAAMVVRPAVPVHETILFVVIQPDDNDVEPRAYIEVFDESNELLYSPRRNERERLRLKQPEPALARATRAFIEALNAAPESSRVAALHQVQQATCAACPLTATVPFQTAAATAAPALELPATPPAWWRDRQPGETPDNWLRTHYKPFIDAGLITRGFFQRPKQDKAFANALIQWEKEGNKLPDDLYIPKKAELNTRQVDDLGGITEARARLRSPEVRAAKRLYQTALRRLG